ncbi:hypothetical protein CEXT_732651 [Caerostris extrusa]|uniref:Transposase n=1 Tax=Caerostris extrusa TaxID=172846 RepID=A0AAV4QXC5_CAEEX|nr:hypothetical protein CEXT_732651 [Caerostris extrusa]
MVPQTKAIDSRQRFDNHRDVKAATFHSHPRTKGAALPLQIIFDSLSWNSLWTEIDSPPVLSRTDTRNKRLPEIVGRDQVRASWGMEDQWRIARHHCKNNIQFGEIALSQFRMITCMKICYLASSFRISWSLLKGYLKSLVCETPIKTLEDLIALSCVMDHRR